MNIIESKAATVVDEVKPVTAEGWMCWHRNDPKMQWIYTQPNVTEHRNYWKTPYPLHATRESALTAAQHWLPNGGDVRLVYIQL